MFLTIETDLREHSARSEQSTKKRMRIALDSSSDETDDPPTDEEVVRMVVDGDRNCFRTLITRHQNTVFSMIMRQTGNPSLAEELTQESFIKAFSQLHTFRAEAKFSTWIIRIALNHTNSYYSSRAFKQSIRSESFDLGSHDQVDLNVAEQQSLREELGRLRKCILSLRPKFREVIMLCGLEGKSYQEAAEIIDIPVGTVRSRLRKARLQLKNSFVVTESDSALPEEEE